MDVLRNLFSANFRFWKFEARNVSCRECLCGEEFVWRCVARFAPQSNGADGTEMALTVLRAGCFCRRWQGRHRGSR